MCLEILEAPVPFIVGVPKPVTEGMTFTKDAWCQQTAIVMLDLGQVFICKCPYDSTEVLKKLPSLAGLAKGLEGPFQQFAKDLPKDTLAYHPTKRQNDAVATVCHRMRMAIEKTMLGALPKTIPKKEDGTIDLERVSATLQDSADAVDREFMNLFCETQMYASLVEERSMPL